MRRAAQGIFVGDPSFTLGVGIIGAGQISHIAADSFARHPRVALRGIADPHQGRAGALAARIGSMAVFSDAEQLLSRQDIDAVYIATPNAFHAPLTTQALRAGKHVLVEKPFALHANEAETLALEAELAGRVLTVSMNQRFRADVQRVRSVVAGGILGDVYHARAFWFRRAGIPKLGTWFGKRALAGGGALMDIGVHLLDLALFTMGNFALGSVSGAVHSTFGSRGLGQGDWGHSDVVAGEFDVDDFATALIRFRNGSTLSLDASWAMHQAESERFNVMLHGSAAAAGCFPGEIYQFPNARAAGPERRALSELSLPLAYSHESSYWNFVNHLLGDEELCVSLSQALTVQRVLDAIYESASTGKEVQLGTDD